MKKSRSNLRVVSHIAVLALVLVIAVVATFSWYNRSASSFESGSTLKYTQTGNVSGKSGDIQTYVGVDDNGIITYETALTDGMSVTTEPGAVNYFKTVITDSSNTGDSMISLYLEDFACSTSMGNAIHIGLVEPEKTYKAFTGTANGSNYVIDQLCLIDNVFIKNNGTVEVFWFIEIDKNYTGTGSINLGTLHLVYN